LPSSTAHTYTLTNYCFGKGKLNYKWNWGDGSPLDTGATPSHTYASAGVYQICVEITDSIGCISSFCTPANSYLAKTTGDMIFVSVVKGTTGINNIEVAQKPISIYPNPSGSIIHIVGTWNDNIANIEIVDFLGKSIINQKNVVNGNKLNTNIDLGQIPSGTYFVKIISENKVETHKIFKQ
jgi:PKD repeat protein